MLACNWACGVHYHRRRSVAAWGHVCDSGHVRQLQGRGQAPCAVQGLHASQSSDNGPPTMNRGYDLKANIMFDALSISQVTDELVTCNRSIRSPGHVLHLAAIKSAVICEYRRRLLNVFSTHHGRLSVSDNCVAARASDKNSNNRPNGQLLNKP